METTLLVFDRWLSNGDPVAVKRIENPAHIPRMGDRVYVGYHPSPTVFEVVHHFNDTGSQTVSIHVKVR